MKDVPLNEASLQEIVLRTLGIGPVLTLEYLWNEAGCLPGDAIPKRLLEGDYGMHEALSRLSERTGLVRKSHRGWKMDRKVYDAVMSMTNEQAAVLGRNELIRQTVTGALEHYGLVSYRKLGEMFAALGVEETAWRTVCDDLFEELQQTLTYNYTSSDYLVHPMIEDAQAFDDIRRQSGVLGVMHDPAALRERFDWLPGNADLYYPVLEWLSHCGVSVEDGAVLMQNAVYAMQPTGDPDDLLKEIEEATADGEIPTAVRSALRELAASLPRWTLGGASLRDAEKAQHPEADETNPT